MRKDRMWAGALSALLLFSLCACAGPRGAGDYGVADSVASPSTGSSGGGGEVANASEQKEASAPQESPRPAGKSKRIYRGELSLETTQFEEAQTALDRLVEELGGYYQERSISGLGNGYRNGWYVARIPTDRFDEFYRRTGEVCHVLSAYTTSEDVSESYYDLESRLKTQETKLDRLQELLSKASSMEDIIALESAISETEQAIEGLTGYDSLIDDATVTLTLQEVYQLSAETQKLGGFSDKLGNALSEGLRSAGRGLEGVLLGLASHWVVVIISIALALVGWRVWRKRRHSMGKPVSPKKGPSQPSDPPAE